MLPQNQNNFLIRLDEETRERYIRAKRARGIDVMRADAPSTMELPDPRYNPPYAIQKELEKIHRACENGDLETVQRLVQDEKYNPNQTYLSDALATAVTFKRLPIVEYLLALGAEIDRQVVSKAAIARSLPIFELMVQAGWDVNAPGLRGCTVLPHVISALFG